MNIDDGGFKEEVKVMFHDIIDNDIKTAIVKEEPKEPDYPIKCEICYENSDDGKFCVHHQNDRLGNVEQKQEDKLQELNLCSVIKLQTNGDVRTKIESTDCSSSQKQGDSIIDTGITIKEEEYLDTPEHLSMNIDFVESQTGQVKTEDDDDIFYEDGQIAKFKEEPIDNDDSLGSDTLVQDEISIEDVKPDFTEKSQEGFKRKIQTDYNNFTTDEVTKDCSNATEKPQYRCPFCSKAYAHNSRLIIHERIHTGEKPFQCDVCSKCFSSKCQLVPHQRTHTGDRRFQCKICSKLYYRSSMLKAHQRTHTGERPFQCDICMRSFYTASNLAGHRKIHTGEKTYRCEVCAKSFVRKVDLNRHEKIHKGKRRYECEVCSTSFVRRIDLDRHVKIHKVKRQYECEVCSKSFINDSYLVAHRKIHERPVKYLLCPKAIVRNGQLKQQLQKKGYRLLRKHSGTETCEKIAGAETLKC